VVDDLRHLAVGVDLGAGEVGDDLFVGHREHHVTVGAILEARHFGADLVIAASFLPDIGRVDDRHHHFLAADGVHLLADDPFDLAHDPPTEREEAEDAGAERPDHAGAQHQLVADDLDIARRVTQRPAKLV